jgi:xylose isomerase
MTLGQKEFFKGIGQVKFEGLNSDNPLAYRWYEENRVVCMRLLAQLLRQRCRSIR